MLGMCQEGENVRGLAETPLFVHIYTRGCWIYSQSAISKTPSLTYYLLYMRIQQHRIRSCEVLCTPHSHLYKVSLSRLLSYYHTKDTRNVLCSRCVIWENLILSLVTHGYINIIQRSTRKQEKWKWQDVHENVMYSHVLASEMNSIYTLMRCWMVSEFFLIHCTVPDESLYLHLA